MKIGNESAGTLFLVDTMIRLQGLEKTLEDIRAVNKLNINAYTKMSEAEKKEMTKIWGDMLNYALRANMKARKI